MIQRLVIAAILVTQVVLAGYELVASYDTLERQVALTLTNVFTIGAFLLVSRFLRRQFGITLHWVVLVILAAAVWLDALGNFQYLYGRFWWWDRLTHATGGLAVTAGVAFVTFAVWNAGRFKISWRVANLYAFCLAQTVGALYEVSEWLGDEWFGTHRVGGSFDSPRDLMFNMLGGLVVIVCAAWWRMRHRAVRTDAK